MPNNPSNLTSGIAQCLPPSLHPTPAQLQAIADACFQVAKAIRCYEQTLGAKGAAAIEDPEAKLAFLGLL